MSEYIADGSEAFRNEQQNFWPQECILYDVFAYS